MMMMMMMILCCWPMAMENAKSKKCRFDTEVCAVQLEYDVGLWEDPPMLADGLHSPIGLPIHCRWAWSDWSRTVPLHG